jgi:hypothetical protein
VLHSLGYNESIQNVMLDTARSRISRRQGKGQSPALSPTEITARAHGQVQEHLDEAIHGSRGDGTDRRANMIIDLQAAQATGARGYSVESVVGDGNPPPGPLKRQRGMGLTADRTPAQTAMRKATKALVSQPGGWRALKDADAVHEAYSNHLEELTLRNKARKAMEVAPSERNVFSPGADPEAASKKQQGPTFSTNNPGVGKMPKGYKAAPAGPKTPGEVSQTPSNLPAGPDVGGVLGRDTLARRKKEAFAGGIAAYVASRPTVTPKEGGVKSESNVQVAQTAHTPAEPMAAHPLFAGAGLSAARSQDISLGQRGATGQRSAFKQIR